MNSGVSYIPWSCSYHVVNFVSLVVNLFDICLPRHYLIVESHSTIVAIEPLNTTIVQFKCRVSVDMAI